MSEDEDDDWHVPEETAQPKKGDAWRDALQTWMEEKGVGSRELARRAGVGETMVSDLLRRKTSPSIANFSKIAQAMGFSMDDLFHSLRHRVTFIGGERKEIDTAQILCTMEVDGKSWRHLSAGEYTSVPTIPMGRELSAAKISGDNLMPLYFRGDILVCYALTTAQYHPGRSLVSLVETVDGLRLICRVHGDDGEFTLLPLDPRLPVITRAKLRSAFVVIGSYQPAVIHVVSEITD